MQTAPPQRTRAGSENCRPVNLSLAESTIDQFQNGKTDQRHDLR
jgi:hypothetical protein